LSTLRSFVAIGREHVLVTGLATPTWSRSTRRRKKPSTTVRPTLQKMRQWAKEAEPFSRAVAEAQYDRTQACLAEAGVDSVVIYRGLRWDIGEATGPEWAEVAYRCAIPGLAEVPPDHEVGLVVPDQEVSLAPCRLEDVEVHGQEVR